jgi:hypothetical protein
MATDKRDPPDAGVLPGPGTVALAPSARGWGCLPVFILDAIAWLILLVILLTLTLAVAGVIAIDVMVRAGADARYILTASLMVAADLALFGVLVWLLIRLVLRLWQRPTLCAACGRVTSTDEATLCERCASRGEPARRGSSSSGRLLRAAGESVGVTKGALIIRRKPGLGNYFGEWHVILDEQDIGTIRRGEERRFEVPAGPHVVRLRIASYRTNSIELPGTEPEVLLECGRDDEEYRRLLINSLIWRPSRIYRLTRLM